MAGLIHSLSLKVNQSIGRMRTHFVVDYLLHTFNLGRPDQVTPISIPIHFSSFAQKSSIQILNYFLAIEHYVLIQMCGLGALLL